MRTSRALIAAVPLALLLAAAVFVTVAVTPGSFGFRAWPVPAPEKIGDAPLDVPGLRRPADPAAALAALGPGAATAPATPSVAKHSAPEIAPPRRTNLYAALTSGSTVPARPQLTPITSMPVPATSRPDPPTPAPAAPPMAPAAPAAPVAPAPQPSAPAPSPAPSAPPGTDASAPPGDTTGPVLTSGRSTSPSGPPPPSDGDQAAAAATVADPPPAAPSEGVGEQGSQEPADASDGPAGRCPEPRARFRPERQ